MDGYSSTLFFQCLSFVVFFHSSLISRIDFSFLFWDFEGVGDELFSLLICDAHDREEVFAFQMVAECDGVNVGYLLQGWAEAFQDCAGSR